MVHSMEKESGVVSFTSVTPVRLPVRKLPLAVKEKVKDELDRLVKKDIIIPVKVPTDWILAMVLVTK